MGNPLESYLTGSENSTGVHIKLKYRVLNFKLKYRVLNFYFLRYNAPKII